MRNLGLTKEDCYDYIYNLTINRTFDGYLREKTVVNDGLVKIFTEVRFEESPPEIDHSGDIDYLGYVTAGKAGSWPIIVGSLFLQYENRRIIWNSLRASSSLEDRSN